MNFLEQIQRIERLDQLIRLRATGTPRELAKRLRISSRQLFNLLYIMRNELEAPIKYDNDSNSYVYSEQGQVVIRYKFVRKGKEK